MSELNLDAIEQRAKAATPGEWHSVEHMMHGATVVGGGRAVALCTALSHEKCVADAAHIAGMDPQTTLALVAEVRRLRAENAAMREHGLPCAHALQRTWRVAYSDAVRFELSQALSHAEALLAGLEDENV